MNPVIVIPARGGSKRLPGKNLMEIGGKSLVRRCVEAAVATKLGPVYVNSDSWDIAKEGERAGANVYIRPSFVACDISTTASVIVNMAPFYGWSTKQVVILMQCTSPFTTAQNVIKCHWMYSRWWGERKPTAAGLKGSAPSGAVYVFPVRLAMDQAAFDDPANWEFVPCQPAGLVDIDTQQDFDLACALHARIGFEE